MIGGLAYCSPTAAPSLSCSPEDAPLHDPGGGDRDLFIFSKKASSCGDPLGQSYMGDVRRVAPDPPLGAPRDVCMRCVVNALFYWVKTGCQWKLLPTNLPTYGTVYQHFRRWSADGTLERIAHDLQRQVRRDAGRDPDPSRRIVASQSAPTAEAVGSVILTRPSTSISLRTYLTVSDEPLCHQTDFRPHITYRQGQYGAQPLRTAPRRHGLCRDSHHSQLSAKRSVLCMST